MRDRSKKRAHAARKAHRATSPGSRSVRAALVRVRDEVVIVVEAAPWVVNDGFEAQLLKTAVELTCRRPAVLCALEPCGCRHLYGRREHITAIDRMPAGRFRWQIVKLDATPPTRAPSSDLN